MYFQILYVTASGRSEPAVLEGKIPFEEMVYTERRRANPAILSGISGWSSVSLVHSRKLSIRAMIEMEIGREKLRKKRRRWIWRAGSIYKKQKPVNLLELHTTKKDTYRIKEEITIPGTKESVGQVLLTDITGRKLECRQLRMNASEGGTAGVLYVSVRGREGRLAGAERSL